MYGLKTGLLLSTSPSFFTAGDILINDVLIVWKQVAHTHTHARKHGRTHAHTAGGKLMSSCV